MIGFIAQEFETVFPGLVKDYKDTIDKEVEDENGFKSIEAVETGTTTKHIKEGKLILDKSGLDILSAEDLNDAAKKIVKAIK